MTLTRRSLLALVMISLFALSASAQVTTGTPPFGTLGGGPDLINLSNLNAHIGMRVANKPGRGLPFTYNISYDSSIWIPTTSGSAKLWQPAPTWGWTEQSAASSGYLTYAFVSSNCYTFENGRRVITGTLQLWYDFIYYDAQATSHSFGSASTEIATGTCGSSTPPVNATAIDGSGYQLYFNSGPQVGTVTNPVGTVFTPPRNAQTGAATVTDRNGNEVSVSSGGVFTDTLGGTALTVAGSGTPASPTTFTYTAPSGANAAYTVKYTAFTVQTKFGCSGIFEYGPTSNNLVSEVDLPDGSKYSFTYESTPGVSGNVTGRLASVTLPTGGTITYGYSGGGTGVNGISCADGSGATLTRTTSDGTWTYAQVKGTGAASTTTVTDPQSNQTVIQFQSALETQRQVYQGSTSGTLLQTINTCYNGAASPCTTTAITAVITRVTQLVALPNNSGKVCEHDQFFNAYSLQTEQDDYDYGNGAPATPALRKIITVYDTALTNGIVSMPSSITICTGSGSSSSCNGAGTQVAQTTFAYDQTTPTATSGIPQHVSVTGSRGNLTSVNYPVTSLTQNFTYYDTGSPNTSQDVNGGATTYNYSSNAASCQMAFPTGITEAISTLTQSYTWNCTGGVQLSATDENSQVASTTYSDPYFWRPASANDQENNVTSFGYATNPMGIWSSLPFNSNQSVANTGQGVDGLGRPIQVSHIQAPGATTWDQVVQSYDSNGRLWKTSAPCVTTGPWTCPITGQTNTYDALNRTSQVTDAGGGTTTYTYTQNDVLVTVGPAPSGENTKRRQLEYDALGRLTSVCELTALPGSGTCGQNTTQTGYWTKYTYDALGDLLTVTQNAQTSSGNQSRSYSYDAMSRLTSETNPESGTTTYGYDSVSGTICTTTSPGDLIKRTDANGNYTCFNYDALHRLTDVGNNIQGSTNPCKRFRYDNTTGILGSIPSGVSVSNKLGHLVEAETDTCTWPVTQSSLITDEWFSYTARGETSDVYELTPHSSPTYYHVSQTYWPNGGPNVLGGSTNNIGLPTIMYGAEGEGRPSTVSSSSGQNPVSATKYYNLYQSPYQLSVTFGSGDSDVFTYDPNTFRLNKYQFKIGTQTVTGTLGWNANWSLGSLNISDPFSTADTQNCSFAADDLARISQVSCGTIWGQNFTYDPFGNIQKNGISGTGGSSFTPTYQSSPSITNRVSTAGGVSATYDANGNSLNDTFRTSTWNVFSNPITIGSVSLTYDAFDRMVDQSVGGANSEIIYGPAGVKLALMNGTALTKAFVPLPGGDTAVYTSGGLAYYRHTDHLGSSRFASTPTQTLYADLAYSPFGETYASSGAIDPSFTGQNQDTTGGLYDFLFREYDPNQSRWTSPDPAGLISANPAYPQSWNRYVYVLNDPLRSTDPLGFACVSAANGEIITDEDGNQLWTDAVSCEDYGGGAWIDPFSDSVTVAANGPDDNGILDGGSGGGSGGGGNSSGGFISILQDYFKHVPLAGGIFIPIPYTLGTVSAMIPLAHIPSSGTKGTNCVGLGLAATTPTGKFVSGGPLLIGDLNNALPILSGWGYNFGAQATPFLGVQATVNSSGALAGPTLATGTGLSAGYGYSVCR